MSAVVLPLLVAALLVGLDQITKIIVMQTMTLHQSIVLIPGFFEFQYVRNPAAAMGFFKNVPHARIILIVLTVIVMAAFLYAILFRRIRSNLALWASALILAGGVGNLIDRIFRGEVVDFMLFQFSWFPFIFNVADIYVVVGGGMIILHLILEIIQESRHGRKDEQESDE